MKLTTSPKWSIGGGEIGELTRQICQEAASNAMGLRELAVLYAEFESHKCKANLLDEALEVNRKEGSVAIIGTVGEQRAQLDAAGARMAKIKNRGEEASASNPMYCTINSVAC